VSEDPLSGLSRRKLEELRERIDRELQSCVIDGREGAVPMLVSNKGTRATLLICIPCFERLRLPQSRSEEGGGA